MWAELKRMVRRYVVCKMALVLLPTFFLPNKTKHCKSDWAGVASMTKHCLAISPKESKSDVFECVLVEADRRLGRQRETNFSNIFGPQINVARPFTCFFNMHYA